MLGDLWGHLAQEQPQPAAEGGIRRRRARPRPVIGDLLADVEGVDARGEGGLALRGRLEALLALDAAARADLTAAGVAAVLLRDSETAARGQLALLGAGLAEHATPASGQADLEMGGELAASVHPVARAAGGAVHRGNENALALLMLEDEPW